MSVSVDANDRFWRIKFPLRVESRLSATGHERSVVATV